MPKRKTKKTRKKKAPTRKPKKPSAFDALWNSAMTWSAHTLAAVLPSKETLKKWVAKAWQSRTTRRVAGLIGGAAFLIAVALIMRVNLEDNARWRVDPGRFALASAPSWCKQQLGLRIKQQIETDVRADLSGLEMRDGFSESTPEELAATLEKNPWIKRVVRVERRFPDGPDAHTTLHPILEIRTPALVVASGNAYLLVDADGVILPFALDTRSDYETFASQLRHPIRVVHGVDGDAPNIGQVWDNEQLRAAISMERVLRKSHLDDLVKIREMELIGIPEKADGRGRVHYTPGGGVLLLPDKDVLPDTKLLWGRPPVHASTLELSVNDKLKNLKDRLGRPRVSDSPPTIDLTTTRQG